MNHLIMSRNLVDIQELAFVHSIPYFTVIQSELYCMDLNELLLIRIVTKLMLFKALMLTISYHCRNFTKNIIIQ